MKVDSQRGDSAGPPPDGARITGAPELVDTASGGATDALSADSWWQGKRCAGPRQEYE